MFILEALRMTPKEKRTIEADLKALFSVKAFLKLETINKWKAVGLFHPSVRTETSTHPLSDSGIAALRRITRIIQGMTELKECSRKEIAQQIHEGYETWIKQSLQPDADEFVAECRDKLLLTVKERSHLISLAGLELDDVDQIELGRVTICKPDMERLRDVQFGGAITREWIESQFTKDLWLIGRSHGSPEAAFKQFEHQATLAIGILAVCGSLLYEGAIWQSYLRAGLSPFNQVTPMSIFRWEENGENPTLTRSWGDAKKLPLKTELIEYLRKECFLDQMSSLMESTPKSEVEESIERALYWFADAHGDRNTTMRFVKLWSCAECFFAINEEEITEANARGIASVLTAAGYGVSKAEEYRKLKSRLKELYDLRSRAVHRAEFDGVELRDLQDLSRWMAWVIVSMTALSQRGYRTLVAVREQVIRLDSVLLPRTDAAPQK